MAAALPVPAPEARLSCRFCEAPLTHGFVDLGAQPPANAYPSAEDLGRPERVYPLRAHVCAGCLLVQIEPFQTPEELFTDYAYFSSYSESWLKHAERYARDMTARFALDRDSLVVEVASNDGYLLRFFRDLGIPVLGVEPAANVARVAQAAGIPTVVRFFGAETARVLRRLGHHADLIAANNVLAHVNNINDFVEGFKILLKSEGVLTVEVPHLLNLIAHTQFDTIYHEHFSYLSLLATERILAAHGLRVFDVEELETHGGSLRLYAGHADAARAVTARVDAVRAKERDAGLHDLATYAAFPARVEAVKRRLRALLTDIRSRGGTVAGYGAPAKGNTLLNACGIGTDLIAFTVDRSPHKQGRFLPGSRIPIRPPEALRAARPDYVLILPWNLKDEIMDAAAFIRDWGGRFIVPIPEPRIVE